MATENILMEAVAKGGDRQALHERIRQHSLAAKENLNRGQTKNDLMDRLAADPAFANIDFNKARDPKAFVGRAAEQVDEFLASVIVPIRQRYAHRSKPSAEVVV
jgi:adenylosuccinate lyase